MHQVRNTTGNIELFFDHNCSMTESRFGHSYSWDSTTCFKVDLKTLIRNFMSSIIETPCDVRIIPSRIACCDSWPFCFAKVMSSVSWGLVLLKESSLNRNWLPI